MPQEHQWSHLARAHQVFSKSNKGPCTAAQPAVPPLPQLPVLKASCGVAQLHSLGSACWENSPVGKHCGENLAGSASTLLESCFPSQLFPALSAWATLPCTAADPDPNPYPTASTSSLATCLPGTGQSGSWLQLLAPDLLCSLGWGYHGAAALPLLPHTAPAPSPGAQTPLAPWPKAKGSQVTQATWFSMLSHTKTPSGFHEKTIFPLEISAYFN